MEQTNGAFAMNGRHLGDDGGSCQGWKVYFADVLLILLSIRCSFGSIRDARSALGDR